MILLSGSLRAQYGRVVLNEYMPWPGNACGTTAEFVELFNMGPGPSNIGCYILTDGDYSVTIPAGTILMPGQFYMIAGQSFIPAPCANISRPVVADLNWNTCGCTNAPIPTTGDGFFTDGGAASEQVVLLNPAGQVVDAVVRATPEPSSLIFSAATPGCSSRKFNLDGMGITYETIGESAGRGNSIARKLDGDCGWVKDTQQSGGQTNNTPGEKSSLSMSMFITEDLNCTGGTARFIVNTAPAAAWFPLDYILGRDEDGDGVFTFADSYTTGIDFTAPDLVISNLPLGLYAINIGPKQGCSYQNFVFRIGPCAPLAFSIQSFDVNKTSEILFDARVAGCDQVAEIILEGSTNGQDFEKITDLSYQPTASSQNIDYHLESTNYTYFRLAMADANHKTSYSPVRSIQSHTAGNSIRLAGNPVTDQIRLLHSGTTRSQVEVQVINSAGQVLLTRQVPCGAGTTSIQVPVGTLPKGLYFVKAGSSLTTLETFKVIKQ